jgi:mycofactocin precursor
LSRAHTSGFTDEQAEVLLVPTNQSSVLEATSSAASDTAELLDSDLLVEEVSIDGMCGVY